MGEWVPLQLHRGYPSKTYLNAVYPNWYLIRHGGHGSMPRYVPDQKRKVLWIGSVQPHHAAQYDEWWDTSWTPPSQR